MIYFDERGGSDTWDGGQRWSIAQVTYTLLKTCWNVTITGDRTLYSENHRWPLKAKICTRPTAACRISSTAAVWNTWGGHLHHHHEHIIIVIITHFTSAAIKDEGWWAKSQDSRRTVYHDLEVVSISSTKNLKSEACMGIEASKTMVEQVWACLDQQKTPTSHLSANI